MCSWGKWWTIRYKKDTNHFWGARSKSRVLRMIPAHSTTNGVGRPPKLHLMPDPLDPPSPSPHLRNQLSPRHLREWARHMFLVFTPSCTRASPKKALPEFLVWSLINFYWLKRPKTWAGNLSILSSKGHRNLEEFKVISSPYPNTRASGLELYGAHQTK